MLRPRDARSCCSARDLLSVWVRAYLIPYFILLVVIGIPLFFLELAVGQRIRRGSIGVWNYISPRLGGIGFASCLVCFFVALYYNVIIGWSLFYFSQSFQQPLPWHECPLVKNQTHTYIEPECEKSSATTFYWYREALNISDSISEGGGLNWKMTLCLLFAWTLVMYFSSLFPYVVLICFLVRAFLLKGSVDGIAHMFTPKLEIMLETKVWREAATQVFFALGLGFGGVIAFSSYNKRDNNCHFDAVLVSFINFFTSVLATLVVFAVLGFKANIMNAKCVEMNTKKIVDLLGKEIKHSLIPHHINFSDVTPEDYHQMTTIIRGVMENDYPRLGLANCDIKEELNKRSGNYFVAMFDDYSATLPLLIVVLLENIAVAWIYGTDKFFEDLKDMLGFTPYRFYYYMWKFVTPVLLIGLLVTSIIQLGLSPPSYSAWNQQMAQEQSLSYPPWGLAVCISLVVFAILPVPVVFILRCLNIIDENAGGLSTVSYKKGLIIKETTCLTREDEEGDDASLLHAKTPSEAPSPMPSNYRKQSSPPSSADIMLNGNCGTGYVMPNITDIPDMPESDL
ncbi:Sodium-dependent neutral amino acid transporter B(0)AT2 [Triplophysa tibetana]|uniref:Sodium-dependent neutral amino acid transporter B(0)AT2 n=1 Tax=Triplophysa tibetana TaxID=1572043 RepID=A0A5A9P0E9_9TELE|nr:Sodium-dependent neutral amino acid transporter B(0)AT2 [Triplophysa tibetana]